MMAIAFALPMFFPQVKKQSSVVRMEGKVWKGSLVTSATKLGLLKKQSSVVRMEGKVWKGSLVISATKPGPQSSHHQVSLAAKKEAQDPPAEDPPAEAQDPPAEDPPGTQNFIPPFILPCEDPPAAHKLRTKDFICIICSKKQSGRDWAYFTVEALETSLKPCLPKRHQKTCPMFLAKISEKKTAD